MQVTGWGIGRFGVRLGRNGLTRGALFAVAFGGWAADGLVFWYERNWAFF